MDNIRLGRIVSRRAKPTEPVRWAEVGLIQANLAGKKPDYGLFIVMVRGYFGSRAHAIKQRERK